MATSMQFLTNHPMPNKEIPKRDKEERMPLRS